MDKSIIPECYADTLLIETLVPTNKGYNHQHSCFKVETAMKRLDSFAVGIIDRDKKTIAYLDEFECKETVYESLKLWRHKNNQKHHWIIQICPALEVFILTICKEEGVSLADFGEGNLEELKRYTKSIVKLNDPKLIKLFNEINLKNGNVKVRKLKHWVSTLRNKNYSADINDLING
ncbi:MAG: hypothetical protein JST86_18050 [Bacteroidetes bacterium]|nr:hypothetical protein [Bacteroidota bacterium]